MADLTYHHCEWVLIMRFMRANVTVLRDYGSFQDAGEERRHHQGTSHRLRSEYDRSVRHHQDHDDPALPVVNRRGASLIPLLASRDEPAVQPKRRFYRRAIPTDGTHGATLIPLLASHAVPSCEPETPESLKAAELLREQNRKTVNFAEGSRSYIKPTYIHGVPGHTSRSWTTSLIYLGRRLVTGVPFTSNVRNGRTNLGDTPTRMGGIGNRP
jgi:hypothetical protein